VGLVVVADAVVEPGAMVVHLQHTPLALPAVVAPWWFMHLALAAEPHFPSGLFPFCTPFSPFLSLFTFSDLFWWLLWRVVVKKREGRGGERRGEGRKEGEGRKQEVER